MKKKLNEMIKLNWLKLRLPNKMQKISNPPSPPNKKQSNIINMNVTFF